MHAETPAIAWVHRKPRRLGNFSMEATFRRLHAACKEHPPTEYTVSEISKGILPRWSIWREVRELDAVFHYLPPRRFEVCSSKRLGKPELPNQLRHQPTACTPPLVHSTYLPRIKIDHRQTQDIQFVIN